MGWSSSHLSCGSSGHLSTSTVLIGIYRGDFAPKKMKKIEKVKKCNKVKNKRKVQKSAKKTKYTIYPY